MDIPELPWWSIQTRHRCPVCNEPIAGWAVRQAFACPSCDVSLTAQPERARLIATIVSAVFYGLIVILLNVFEVSAVGIGLTVVGLLLVPVVWIVVNRRVLDLQQQQESIR